MPVTPCVAEISRTSEVSKDKTPLPGAKRIWQSVGPSVHRQARSTDGLLNASLNALLLIRGLTSSSYFRRFASDRIAR